MSSALCMLHFFTQLLAGYFSIEFSKFVCVVFKENIIEMTNLPTG